MSSKLVRIGNTSGFWGDNLEASLVQIEKDQVDYLTLDLLAEVTMSILRKQMQQDERTGYARDVISVLRAVLPLAVANRTTVVTNAGGLNPRGCGNAVQELVNELGLADHVRIAVVEGDDIFPRLDEFVEDGEGLRNMDTGAPFSTIAGRVVSANAYIGAGFIRDALASGANVVIAGRSTDTALTLGPLMFEHGWADDDWDRLAAGIVAGHLIECGAQVTGGNHQAAWRTVPDLASVGYPIAEVDEHGTITITKTRDTGGRVSVATVTEQALYEVGDPKNFLTPDVNVDWTTLAIVQDGVDRVRLSGATGSRRPSTLKVSTAYHDGYMTALYWLYAWPDALAKAHAAKEIIDNRIEQLGLQLDAMRSDIIGAGAVHGPRWANPVAEPPEVIQRIAARSSDRSSIERLAKEVAPMLFGPPGLAGFIFGGRGKVSEVIGYWPTLVPRQMVDDHVSVTLLEPQLV